MLIKPLEQKFSMYYKVQYPLESPQMWKKNGNL